MTVIYKALVQSKFLESVQTSQYAATGVKAIIDKCTVFNGTAGAVAFGANLVNSGGTAGSSNLFISRLIQVGEEYECPELVGQVLEQGGFLSTIAGSPSSLTFRVSGREIS